MVTPTKEQIEKLARELYVADQYRNGTPQHAETNPETYELAESGYLFAAKSQLMMDEHKAQIESEYINFPEPFTVDIAEAMNTTSFVGGSRGVGKSDVVMYIADQLMKEGITVIAFDPSTDWRKRSSISQYLTVQSHSVLPIPKDSTIFDISLLTPMQAQRCVEGFCKKLFEFQLNSDKRFYLVFEESQIFFPLNSLRSKKTQNSMRIITVGRNVHVSACAVSQFPALIDKELIKHSGQIWIGYTTELNTLRYWNGILGEHTERLKELRNGEFLYYHRNNISLTEIEPFQNSTPKRLISVPESTPIPKPQAKAQTENLNSLISFAILLLWLFAIFIAVSQM